MRRARQGTCMKKKSLFATPGEKQPPKWLCRVGEFCRKNLNPKRWEKDTRIFFGVLLSAVLVLGTFSFFTPSDERMRQSVSPNMQQKLAEDAAGEQKSIIKTENSLGFIKYFSYATTGNTVMKEAYVGILGQVYDASLKSYRIVYRTGSVDTLRKVNTETGEETVLASSAEGQVITTEAGALRDGDNKVTAYTVTFLVSGVPAAKKVTSAATGQETYYLCTADGRETEVRGYTFVKRTKYIKDNALLVDHTGTTLFAQYDDTGAKIHEIGLDEEGVIRVDGAAYVNESSSFASVVGRLVNFTYRMLGIGENVLHGAKLTIVLTALSVIIGTFFSIFLALGKISRFRIVSKICSFYIFFFRGTPLMIQLFVIYFALPGIIPGFSWTGLFSGTEATSWGAFLAAVVAFSLNTAAYCAEIVRAAIQSIDKGQGEAAKALGMSYGQTMRLIIVPQSIRRLVPPIANEFIMILKDASLVFTISLMDITTISKQISAKGDFLVFVPALVIYLVITWFFSFLFGKLEKRFSLYE